MTHDFGRTRRHASIGVALITAPVIAAIAILAPRGSHADVKAGVAAFERGDYAKAVKEWRVDAGKGDANALFNLGQAYRLGKGVDKDLAEAQAYYRRAVKAGHPAAMGNLANLLYFKKDPPQRKAALDLWRRGARAGDARSQYMLGALTFNGDIVERDLTRGYAWTYLAARTSLKEAQESLKTMRQYVPPEARAKAEKGAPDLMSDSGRLYWQRFVAEDSKGPARARAAPQKPDTAAQAGAPKQPPTATSEEAESAESAGPPSDGGDAAGQSPVYRLNLAAMSEKSRAETVWRRHLDAHGDILADLRHRIVAVSRAGETLYRLQAGRYETRGQAEALCKTLQARDVGCFVVATEE